MTIIRAMKPLPLSIVVPVYNEEESIGPLLERIHGSLEGLAYEVILVDDGSVDRSFELIRSFAIRDPRVRCIRFRGNFGQTAALSAGIDAARGDVIVTLDADLQNDPADIPRLIEKLDEGFDVVSGWRKARRDNSWRRVLPSRIANWLISRITGVKLHDLGCTLKAYRREIIQGVQLYGEMHRFIPIWAVGEGARVTELPVDHHPRRFGVSKYGLGRSWKVLLDLMTTKIMTSYVTKPIYIFGGFGLVLCTLGVGAAGFALFEKVLQGVYVHRNPMALIAVFLFLAGMQLVMMGVLAEFLIRIYHAVRGRPAYAVRETIEPLSADGPPAPAGSARTERVYG
jgi:glycosyltransferase involved in cell wall biosynthesis